MSSNTIVQNIKKYVSGSHRFINVGTGSTSVPTDTLVTLAKSTIMTIENGNVGIGTTNPLQKLHVDGISYLNGAISTNNNNINVGTGTVTATTFSGTATKVGQDLVVGTYLTGTNYNGAGTTTWAVDATSANTANKVVVRDASGNFSAGTITASLTGTATKVGQDLIRGTYLTGTNYNGAGTTTWAVDATSANTASKVVVRDTSGNFSAGTITASGLAGGVITDSTSTTSSSIAASATAVKSSYDLANAALPKTGGTVTGSVVILANLTASNLTVIGDTTILNTISSNTEQMVITNAGTGPALKVTQTGVNNVAEFYDNESGLAMTIANNGLVGIGTTNPLSKLHVYGYPILGGTSTDTGPTRFLSILDSTITNGNSKYITFGKANSTNNQAEFSYTHQGDGSATNFIGMGLYGSLAMSINGDGNVGIGTFAPNNKLHLNGNAYLNGTITTNNNNINAGTGTITAATFSGTATQVSQNLTRGTYLTGSDYNGSVATTWAVDATSANTASKVVVRDASGNFSAGTITASLTGTATKVSNNLVIGTYLTGTNYNGAGTTTWAVDATSANTASKVVVRDASGNFSAGTITASLTGTATRVSQEHVPGTYLTGTNYNGVSLVTWAVDATSANTASKVVVRDASGNFSAGTITASLTGTATKVGQDLVVGTYLTGTNYNGAGTTTWAVDATTTATANKVVVRDASAYLFASGVGIGTATARQLLDVQGGGAIISGNVGIGTTNPLMPLHVVGTNSNTIRLQPLAGASGNVSTIQMWSTFGNYPADTQPRYSARITSGFKDSSTGIWGSEYLAFGVGNNGAANDTPIDPLEKVRITCAGNVGIGTTNPLSKLHVYQYPVLVGNSTDTDPNRFISALDSSMANGTSKYITLGKSASLNNQAELSFFHSSDGSSDNFATIGLYGGNTLYVTGAGRVGIGKTNPAYKLEVAGDINYTGTLYQNGIAFSGGGGGSSQWTTVNTNDIYFNAGNVGIGTNSPLSKLQVKGYPILGGTSTDTDSGRFLSILDSTIANNTAKYICIGKTNSVNNQAEFSYYHVSDGSSANYAGVGLYGGSYLHVTGAGNVGIGTTNPQAKLAVQGTTLLNGTVTTNNNNINAGTGTVTASTFTGTATKVSNDLVVGTYLSGTNYNGAGTTTWAVDATSANTASKVVARDASGNFSAGTITASLTGTATRVSQEHVPGSYLTGTNYNGVGTVTWAVDATTAATANKVVARDASGYAFASGVGIGTATARQLLDVQGGNAIVSGNIGIGTTNPQYKLDLRGDAIIGSGTTASQLYLRDIANASWQLSTYGYKLSFLNDNGGSYVSKMVVDNDGNVGIGTTNPLDKLVVAYSTGEVRFGGTNGRTLSAYKNGILDNFDFNAVQTYFNSDFLIPSTKKISTANSDNGNLYLTTTNSTKGIYTDRTIGIGTATARQLLDVQGGDAIVSGNIGIGLTNPLYPLDVTGAVEADRYISTVATGTAPFTVTSTTITSNLNVNYLGDYDSGFYRNVANMNAGTLVGARGGTGATGFGAQYRIPIASSSGALTNNANFVYNYSTGNLGIGTATPTHKIHLYSATTTDTNYEATGIYLQNESTGETGIAFRNANLGAGNVWIMGLNNNSSRFDIGFGAQTSQMTDASVDMCINTSGNVGIGTTNPTAKLDVKGDIILGSTGNNLQILGCQNPIIIGGALSDETSALNTSNVLKLYAPYNFNVRSTKLPKFTINTAATSTITFDITKNGSTIYSVKPTITNTNVTSSSTGGTLTTNPILFSENDTIVASVNTAGNGGTGAKLYIYCT